MITRYHGQPLPIVVKFPSNPLAPYGKDYDDIEDISMNLKRDLGRDDDDAYLEKKQTTGGVTLDEDKHRFTMLVGATDYENLVAGTVYRLTLNIKVAGVSDYIEIPIRDRSVEVVPDTNRA